MDSSDEKEEENIGTKQQLIVASPQVQCMSMANK